MVSGGTLLLSSARDGFEADWVAALRSVGLDARRVAPAELARYVEQAPAVVLDARASRLDDDELLAGLCLGRALGKPVAIEVDPDAADGPIEDLYAEASGGLVARGRADVPRVVRAIARRLDAVRADRFEYVAVSPRPDELLVLLGDGRAAVLRRPVAGGDDGSEVDSVALVHEGRCALIALRSGVQIALHVEEVRSRLMPRTDNRVVLDGAAIAARIRALRLAAGLTQKELAARAGMKRPNLVRVESGRHTPSLDTILRLAAAIGVAPARVLEPGPSA
ncbi:MAG: helix-turn-helix domain-containing protein [Myxococcota bacterium]|nr:helix-turn-helix domain-containing protein [Myxococcota bacterium]